MNDSEKVIVEEVEQNSKVIPKAETDNTVTAVVTKHSLETPYLPPKFLEEYEKIVPGSGDKIFEMVQEQQKFNMRLVDREMRINEANLERAKEMDKANINEQKSVADLRITDSKLAVRGQIFAFVLALLLMALSAYFAYLGHLKLALAPITIIIGVMVVIFLRKSPHPKQISED